MVIEDRDYRQPQVAKEECDRKRGDREQRGIRVLTWRTWRRHEIENYFLEPAILFPVMAEAFGTTEGEVEQRFHRLVSILAVDQAAQYAIYHMRHPWTDQNLPGRLPPGIPGKEARPRWDPQQNSVVAPAKNEVERHLETAIDKGQEALKEAGSRMRPDDAIRAFHDKCEQWAELEAHRPEWRVDWAGKEILAHMRQWLAAEYGWPDTESGTRERVDWDSMTRSQRGEQERAIERGLQPRLVHKFLALLSNPSSADHWENEIRQEWHAVAEICAAKP